MSLRNDLPEWGTFSVFDSFYYVCLGTLHDPLLSGERGWVREALKG